MESGEGDQVNGELSKIWVKLSWESETACDSWDGSWDQVIKITIGGGGELKGSEADIIEGLVIDDHALISILNELMDWEGGVVGLNDCVRDLGRGDNWEGLHDSIGVLFSDLGDQEGSHTRSSTTSEGVGDLETLEAITTFSFLSDDVEYWVNELSTFSVVTLSPIVTSSSLTKDEVVGSEELAEGTSTDRVHGSWLKIHEDGSGDIASSGGLVVVNVDSLELEIGVSVVCTCGVNTVLIRDDFPELSSDLVTTLSSLDVNDFSHLIFEFIII